MSPCLRVEAAVETHDAFRSRRRSAATAVARSDANAAEYTAGQPIRVELPEGQEATDAKVLPPGAGEPQMARIEKAENAPAVLAYHRTPRAGVYTLSWKDAAGAEQSRPVCVNGDKAESELESIPDAQLRELMGELDVPIIHYTAGQPLLAREGKEIWRTLIQVVLAMAVVESVFAVWVGRER